MSIDLAREGFYRFLAAALRDPRDRGAALAHERESVGLAMAAADILRAEAQAHGVRRGFGELPPDLLTLAPLAALSEASFSDLCAEYDRVFSLVVAAECPPYETEYHASAETFFRSQQLADVAGFYRAFGVDPAIDSPERPDYLPLELEFMSLLLLKKRLAADLGELDSVQICAEAE